MNLDELRNCILDAAASIATGRSR